MAISAYASPGVYVSSSGAGPRPVAPQPFRLAYMLGYSSVGPINEPTLVRSTADFINQFGSSSLSVESVRLYFRNNKNGLLYFSRIGIAPEVTFTVGVDSSTNLTSGSKSVIINGTTVSYTVTGSTTTPAAGALQLKNAIAADTTLATQVVATVDALNTNLVIVKSLNPESPLTFTDLPYPVSITAISAGSVTVAFNSPVASTSYAVSVLGEQVSITTDSSPTGAKAATAFVTALNALPALSGKATAAVGTSTNLVVVTAASSSYNLLDTYVVKEIVGRVTTPTYPRVADITYYLDNVDSSLEPGFLIAPEFFIRSQHNASIRESIALAIEGFCSNSKYGWMGLIDCGPKAQISNYGLAIKEAGELSSPQGHTAYYFPHLVDWEDSVVPASAGVAGMAVRRYNAQGYAEPPAGPQFPLVGVKGLDIKTTEQEQEIASTKRVNFIRDLPNVGITVYDDLTLSSDALFSAISTRVIMNMVMNTLRKSFNVFVLQSIDGRGQYFQTLETTAKDLLNTFWKNGLLWGATPSDGYQIEIVKDDYIELENGIVDMKIYLTPAPRARQILINVVRVAIGSMPNQEIQLVANSAAKDSEAPTTPST